MIRPSSHQKKLLKLIQAHQLHRLPIGIGRRAAYVYGVTSGTHGPRPSSIAALEDAGWIDWTHSNTAVLTTDGRAVL